MIITTHIENFLTPEECDEIIKEFNNSLEEGGVLGTHKNARKSLVRFIEIDDLHRKVLDTINNLVSLKNFYVEKNEEIQFTKYQIGDYFDWHIDTIYDSDNITEKVKNRTYSIVIQLNDDYEGGDFLYEDTNTKEVKVLKKQKGSIFLFNSSIKHKVDKITKGTRYSLVAWLKLKQIENVKKTLL